MNCNHTIDTSIVIIKFLNTQAVHRAHNNSNNNSNSNNNNNNNNNRHSSDL